MLLAQFSIAKSTTLHYINVMNNDSSGPTLTIISGINTAAVEALANSSIISIVKLVGLACTQCCMSQACLSGVSDMVWLGIAELWVMV